MKLALNVGKVTHRTRALVDVELECGCVIAYEFEFDKKPGTPTVDVKARGGWWISTSAAPGELVERCDSGDDCIAEIVGARDAKREGFCIARRHVLKLDPAR